MVGKAAGAFFRINAIAFRRMFPSTTTYLPVGSGATLMGSTSPISSIDDLSRSWNCFALPDRLSSSLTTRSLSPSSISFIGPPTPAGNPCRSSEGAGAPPDEADLSAAREVGRQGFRKPMPAGAAVVVGNRGREPQDWATPTRRPTPPPPLLAASPTPPPQLFPAARRVRRAWRLQRAGRGSCCLT